jgi:acyl-CoA synthetase (AMP-forming)/AMP-acid ligase II
MIDWLLERMRQQGNAPAVGMPHVTITYAGLLARCDAWRRRLDAAGVGQGTVTSLEGDYGPESVAVFLALASRGAVIVPLSSDSQRQSDALLETGEVEVRVSAVDGSIRPVSDAGTKVLASEHGTTVPACERRRATHAHYEELRRRQHPGLVLFSSGSTGKHKGAVHDLVALLRKFETPRHAYRTLVFLQMDHIGGVNTLLYTLSNGGMVVVAGDRSPAAVCTAIARHRVELLPTSPTFLNLLLLSGEHQRQDLSSLRLVTYGTEPMPESTLARLAETLPDVQLLQTYGSTELGILRSKSRTRDSLWVRVGGEGYETKVVDGRLWIRSACAMLGYLNAPSPFDEEGFLDTGDLVLVDGEWIRILGRESEVINVGGSKVYPAEVESVLLGLDNVVDVSVRGEPHPLVGQIVTAIVRLQSPEPAAAFRVRMRQYCNTRLPAYKVPARIEISEGPLHSLRYKRVRRAEQGAA